MAEEAVQNEYSKALQRVIQTSLNHGTLAKGLHEVAKAIERKQA
jgi:ribosomal protein L7Ae-like RNA K-turn-binding protein